MHLKTSIKIIISSIILLWVSGIFAPYFLEIDKRIIIFFPFIKKFYSIICHQEQLKSIQTFYGTAFVCARCTGIYVGLMVSSLVFLFHSFTITNKIKFLFFSSIPLFISVFFTNIGLYQYSKPIAFITGLFFGSVLFLYFYKAMILLFLEIYPTGLK